MNQLTLPQTKTIQPDAYLDDQDRVEFGNTGTVNDEGIQKKPVANAGDTLQREMETDCEFIQCLQQANRKPVKPIEDFEPEFDGNVKDACWPLKKIFGKTLDF